MQNIDQHPSPIDFDFMVGKWNVRHRRLNERLCGCSDWTEFNGRSSTNKILDGFGNVEDNVLYFATGEVKAAAFRSFSVETKTWAIWWLDGRAPHNLDVPVVGKFSGSTGLFFAESNLDGIPIKVRFTWRVNPGRNPTWEQAFSNDGGASWEANWTMEFERGDA